MVAVTVVVECDLEFPRVIVWDALVDADLVSGWLAEATITPELDGDYSLRWLHRSAEPVSSGRILALLPLERIEVETMGGRLLFELEQLDGGSRGSSTHLRVTVEGDFSSMAARRLKADWLTSLDQLDELLRGHPVDWANWNRDRHDAWFQHLGEAGNSTA